MVKFIGKDINIYGVIPLLVFLPQYMLYIVWIFSSLDVFFSFFPVSTLTGHNTIQK